jgi:hypothetical protein
LTFLRANCQQLEEVSLLEDALKQLDELFLVVVVGEFNSGKSGGGRVGWAGWWPTALHSAA